MSVSLIVARYDEDVDWVKNVPNNINVFVYNKRYLEGLVLPNFGREADTYIQHIVRNLQQLSDFNFFVQGNPFHHTVNLFTYLQNYISTSTFTNICDKTAVAGPDGSPDRTGLPLASFYEDFLHTPFPTQGITYGEGSQFVTTAAAIRTRGIGFWNGLLAQAGDDNFPYLMERMWSSILS